MKPEDAVERARQVVREYFRKQEGTLKMSMLPAMGRLRAAEAGSGVDPDSFHYMLTGERTEILTELVSLAPRSPVDWEACKQIAESFLERGEPIPDPLVEFVVGVLNGDNKRPTAKKIGTDPYSRAGRNHVIIMAVWRASEFLPEYSEGLSNRVSACDLVAEVLNEYGIKDLKVSSIITMWKNFKKRAGPQIKPKGEY